MASYRGESPVEAELRAAARRQFPSSVSAIRPSRETTSTTETIVTPSPQIIRDIRGRVKQFNGFGFMIPDEGQAVTGDILINDTVARQVGIQAKTLITGIGLICDVENGTKGWRAIKIAIDCYRPIEWDFQLHAHGRQFLGPLKRCQAVLKRFNPDSVYRHCTPVNGDPDIFFHISQLQAQGRRNIPEGTVLVVTYGPTPKGFAAAEIQLTTAAPTGAGHPGAWQDSAQRFIR